MGSDKKFKVLVLSDHALSTSGVGTQTRHLIEGLLKKECWSFRQFGAAMKHADYRTIVINDDFIIKPIDGFGNPELLRVTIATEKPDIIFLFTDPRFFIWLFEMEDEIHQVCPIVWWHVWDNYPYPKFNNALYESTDLINCHSYMTYEMLKEQFPNKTNFIPHALPPTLFYPLDDNKKRINKKEILGSSREDHFVCIWVNRNAKRKRPSDVLYSWKLFLDKLYESEGHKKYTLIMNTDPFDQEGPNLISVSENLNIHKNVLMSTERIDFEKMNVLYNISDCCINISYAEGFGLGTLESMMTGTPIVAAKTGGLTRQVVDHKDGSQNGVALDVKIKSLVGSQSVPYIYEDYSTCEDAANALYKLSKMNSFEKDILSNKVLKYAKEEFSMQKTIDLWHETMIEKISNWKEDYKRIYIEEF
jgi:glycosyltransferase involved in cell wall biosynthesis